MRLIGNGVRISDCPAAVNPFMFFCGRATARYFFGYLGGKVHKERGEVRIPAFRVVRSGISSM
jgi:hypothetical protein